MQRYFVKNQNVDNNLIYITDNDFHHIKNVMKMHINEQIIVVDENSNVYNCIIKEFLKDKVLVTIINKKIENPEIDINVTIAQGLVKREKKEEVIRRITELGATGYISVIMERSNVKFIEDKIERLNTIVKEACEQSHRNKLMKILNTIDFSEIISFSKDYDLKCFAYEDLGRSNNNNLRILFQNLIAKNVFVLVGPEGGFSDKEVDILYKNNFIGFGLGPRILRTETAPLYIMSIIDYEREIK